MDKATDFLATCTAGQVRHPYDAYVSDDFRHHDAYFPEARESLPRGMEENAKIEPDRSFTAKWVMEAGERVALLSHVRRSNVGYRHRRHPHPAFRERQNRGNVGYRPAEASAEQATHVLATGTTEQWQCSTNPRTSTWPDT
ncbi:hypothetical protein [Stenotrophomonas sp. MYb238]|uniref:hypothetical protein n=1 Tax=Stenotrophomonas sp. MYb238 TaxID=2040281 RepID=UPI001D17AA60|nr:hypothetical protein [Stenotrophomonas sp. MYb238]